MAAGRDVVAAGARGWRVGRSSARTEREGPWRGRVHPEPGDGGGGQRRQGQQGRPDAHEGTARGEE